MKKNYLRFYTLMFLFVFVLPSFTLPQERGPDEKTIQKSSDSVFVNVKFQNPELIVTDDRDAFLNQMKYSITRDAELLNVVKQFNAKFDDALKLQERRYESSMDYLQRKTGYSIGQINKFIYKNNQRDVFIGCFALAFSFILYVIYNASYRQLKESMNGLVMAYTIITVLILMFLYLMWPMFIGHDYISFYKLLKLSP